MRYATSFKKVLCNLDDEPLRGSGDPSLIAAVNAAAQGLPADMLKKFGEQLDEIFGKQQTLAAVVVSALLAPHEDEKNLGEQERMRRFELARRITKATKPEKDGLVEFNTEERDLMKKLVGKRYAGCLVPPTVWELLEDAEKVKEVEPVEKATT